MVPMERSYTHENSPLSPQSFWTRPLPVLVFLSLLAILIYSNTFSSTFHFDDARNIVDNFKIKDLSHFLDFSGTRYVGFLSFALNYAFGGLNVFGYHLVNLVIHITNGFLVYTLVLLLFRAAGRTATFQNRIPWIALVTALLFIAHPIQTQAVTYIVQRFACLVTLFYLLTVVAYLKWRMASPEGHRRYLWYGVALLSTVLAMKTKENSFTLPFMLLLVEGIFFRPNTRKRWVALIPFLLMLPIIPLDRADMLGEAEVGLVQQTTDISRLDYLFTQFRVIMTYLRLLILPIHQNLDYDYPIYQSLFQPAVFFSFLFLVSFFTLAVYLLIRSRRMTANSPLIPFGILWFFLTLSVESSIIPIVDVIFEHRLYLPSVGLFLSFSMAVFASHAVLKASYPRKKVFSLYSSTGSLVGFIVLILILLCVATYQRNHIWKDDLTLLTDVVNKSPYKARGHYNLGLAYRNQNQMEAALKEYQIAITLNPKHVMAAINLGNVYHELGHHDKAIQAYQRALGLNPDHARGHYNLGNVYYDLKWYDEAIQEYQRAITLSPELAEARYNLGNTYHAKGHYNLALREYKVALKLTPDYIPARINLGNVYLALGHFDDAIHEYKRVITQDYKSFEAYYNLGRAYQRRGQITEAREKFVQALKIKPDSLLVRQSLESLSR
jgi:protein O-mannosyl-transferase